MLLRDRLQARLDAMGDTPDYSQLAAEVLGIHNAPPALARRLVSQALVIEDRRDAWVAAGERIGALAPAAPGVYVLRDSDGQPLYVGKAVNLKRRLKTHFAPRRWRGLKAPLARAARAEWQEVGSELEALLREAVLIREYRPVVNVQIGPPAAAGSGGRAVPAALAADVVVVVPSVNPAAAVLVAARADGGWLQEPVLRADGEVEMLAARLWRFFATGRGDAAVNGGAAVNGDGAVSGGDLRLAPLVFSWLAGRGAAATRLDPRDWASATDLAVRLKKLLADEDLFTERLELR